MLEEAGIVILGIGAQWLSWRLKLPAILPLILLGLLVGPISTLWSSGGEKWLEPIYNPETGVGIIPEEYFFDFISLSIGIILFEGGLTLKRKEIRGLGPVILRLISVGSAITFIGAGLATYFLLDLGVGIAFLIGALVIVTGPTVIAPVLQNVPLKRNLATILKWESIIIDPIGAFVSVLVFEFILSNRGAINFTPHALLSFVEIILIGIAIGAIAGFLLYYLVKKDLIPHFLLNVFTLALVLGVFVFSDLVREESGLLSVVVMGTVLGNMDMPKLKDILDFKESLSILLISILFIILAAHINLEELYLLNDWRSISILLIVMFVLRPLGVFVSTARSDLKFNEKLLISLVGPRGIVAAGIASLFGLRLVHENIADAEYITPLVFMIVLGTVLLTATTTRPLASALNVMLKGWEGVLIIGANAPARLIGSFLQKKGKEVVFIDVNSTHVKNAQSLGLEAHEANIFIDDLNEIMSLQNMSYLLALTGSSEVNKTAKRDYRKHFTKGGTYMVDTGNENLMTSEDQADIFPPFDDHLAMMETARDFPTIHEVSIVNKDHLLDILSAMRKDDSAVPLFIWTKKSELAMIPRDLSQLQTRDQDVLVYLGRNMNFGPSENLAEEKEKVN